MFLIDKEDDGEFIQLNLTIGKDQLTPNMLARLLNNVRNEVRPYVKDGETSNISPFERKS